MSITYKEIYARLQEIHEDFLHETLTPEKWEAAFTRGEYTPCGCQICLLMQEVFMADFDGTFSCPVCGLPLQHDRVGEVDFYACVKGCGAVAAIPDEELTR